MLVQLDIIKEAALLSDPERDALLVDAEVDGGREGTGDYQHGRARQYNIIQNEQEDKNSKGGDKEDPPMSDCYWVVPRPSPSGFVLRWR